MTTVQVNTSNMQPSGNPPPQWNPQQGYPPPSGYPQTVYPPQQQVILVQAPSTTTANAGASSRYNKKAGLTTGILQLCAAGILLVLGIVVAVYGLPFIFNIVSWNIWGSVGCYGVAGILGIVSKNQSKCVIIAYMVMCIISAVSAGGNMVWESIAAADNSHIAGYFCDDKDYYYDYTYDLNCSHSTTVTAMHSISAVTAFAEMIVAIVGSAYCCAGCCAGDSATATQNTIVTYAQPVTTGPQVTVVPGGAYPPQTAYNSNYQPPAYGQQQAQLVPNAPPVYKESK